MYKNMSNTVATSPGTMADDATVGTVAWTNPDNAKVSDNVYATVSDVNAQTHYLKATNFGFEIPTGSTINGILVEIERKKIRASATDNVIDAEIKIVKSNGTIGATNKSVGASWSTTESYITFGGVSDVWGETWSSSDINNANFGVVLSANIIPSDGISANVDHIRMTVYYSDVPANLYELNSYTGTGLTEYLRSIESQRSGQSFTGIDAKIHSAKFMLRKNSSGDTPDGSAKVELYSHTGTFGVNGKPNTLLATSNNFDVSTLTTTNQLITFTFSGDERYLLQDGVKYFIILNYNVVSSHAILLASGDLVPLPEGNHVSWYDGDIDWYTSISDSSNFYVYAGDESNTSNFFQLF